MREELERRLQAFGARGHRALVAGVVSGDERASCGWSPIGAPPWTQHRREACDGTKSLFRNGGASGVAIRRHGSAAPDVPNL